MIGKLKKNKFVNMREDAQLNDVNIVLLPASFLLGCPAKKTQSNESNITEHLKC